MHENISGQGGSWGWEALLQTGLVPEGAVFLTNYSPDSVKYFPDLTLENVIKDYKRRGFQVTVIKGKAFDTYVE